MTLSDDTTNSFEFMKNVNMEEIKQNLENIKMDFKGP